MNTLIRRAGESGEEILLVWNSDWRPPEWSLPGGSRECSESLIEAAVREVREETGLEVAVQGLLDVHEKIGLGGRIHLVVFTFAGITVGGDLVCDGRGEPECGGVSDVRWASIEEAWTMPKVARILKLPGIRAEGASCTCDRAERARASRNA